MIEEYNTKERQERRSGKIGEDFTPDSVSELLFEGCEDLYKDFSKTYLDPAGGNGNLLVWVLNHRMPFVKTSFELVDSIDSLYMVELFQNNVDECKDRVRIVLKNKAKELGIKYLNKQIEEILEFNIVCHDAYKWNYKEWKEIPEEKAPISVELF